MKISQFSLFSVVFSFCCLTFKMSSCYQTIGETAISRISDVDFNRNSNETILSRKRRFLLPALAGWILNIRLTLLEPLSTPFGSVFTQLVAFLPFTFKLDSVLTGNRRTLKSRQTERFSVIHALETTMRKVGNRKDSHACMLRTICEVAAAPESGNGIFGDFFNLLLTPQDELEAITNEVDYDDYDDYLVDRSDGDYLKAQQDGHYNQDCTEYEAECPQSVFGFEDETGLSEHHYYEDDFASHDDDFGFDYNSGRGFPKNFSVLYDVEDTL